MAAVAAAGEFSGQVSVTTEEGDRVTLSANFAETFHSMAFQGRSQSSGITTGLREQTTRYALSRNLGFTVEGDLNEEEVRNLTALFRTVGDIFRNLFGGRDEESMAQAVGLADEFGTLATLAALDLDLHLQRSVTVATAGQSVIDPAAPSRLVDAFMDTPGAAPSTPTAIPSSSTGTTAPTPLFNPGPEDRREEQADSLAERLLKAVGDSRLHRETLREFLARLLEQAERDAKATAAPDDGKAATAGRAREKVLDRANGEDASNHHPVAVLSYSRIVITRSRYSVLT